MKILKNLIKNRDFFGQKIELNFNNKGHVHNTFCGGIVGILIELLMGLYIALLIKKTVLNEADSIKSVLTTSNMTLMEPQRLNDTKVYFFIQIINNTQNEPPKIPVIDFEYTKRFIDIKAE